LRRRTSTGKGFSEKEERYFWALWSGRKFALSMVEEYSNGQRQGRWRFVYFAAAMVTG
jgi:hypothetical protein